jgi:hypothetical protein
MKKMMAFPMTKTVDNSHINHSAEKELAKETIKGQANRFYPTKKQEEYLSEFFPDFGQLRNDSSEGRRIVTRHG